MHDLHGTRSRLSRLHLADVFDQLPKVSAPLVDAGATGLLSVGRTTLFGGLVMPAASISVSPLILFCLVFCSSTSPYIWPCVDTGNDFAGFLGLVK